VEGTEVASTIMTDALDASRVSRTTKSQILSLSSKIATLKNRITKLPPTVKEIKINANPEVEAVRAKIATLKAERAVLLGKFQPGSAKIVDIEEEIKSLEDEKTKLDATVRDEFEKPNPARETLQSQIDDLELNKEALEREGAAQEATAKVKLAEAARVAPQGVQLDSLQRQLNQAVKAYEEYESQLREVKVRGLAGKGGGAQARIMEEAIVPSVPIRPQKAQQVALAALMGLMLGVGFAFLQEFLDDRVNSSEDVQRVVALPTLGSVPTIGEGMNCLLIGQDAFSPVTEAYRSLRTSVQYSSLDRKVTLIGVTSAHPGEGKSVTSANLAIAMTLQGKRVILVDADLRRPSVHRLFGVEAEPGLTSVLAGELSLDEALRSTPIEDLQILTSGPLPPNPPELLNSQVMLDLVEHLKERVDVIIFDTPPVIPVTDAQVLGSFLDGMILVVEAGQARKAAVKHARELLDRTRVRILGVVLNKIDHRGKGYYYQYAHSGATYGDGGGYAPLGRRLGTNGDGDSGSGSREKPAALADKLRDWE
jgi:tyrosine-protein kinase Etk/Wzc